jgi:hypothetical protein
VSVLLSGCSLNALIWGADGAEVIDTTNRFASAAAGGDVSGLICAGVDPRLGDPEDWVGVRAEEPEPFAPHYWPGQVDLDPDWSINVSVPIERVIEGALIPGDIFYRSTTNGLCVLDIAWRTVTYSG